MLADGFFLARLHFRDDGEAVARRGPGKDRAVPTALKLEVPPFGIAIIAGFVQSCSVDIVSAPLFDRDEPDSNTAPEPVFEHWQWNSLRCGRDERLRRDEH
jgi:hypothetical protein